MAPPARSDLADISILEYQCLPAVAQATCSVYVRSDLVTLRQRFTKFMSQRYGYIYMMW